MFGGAYDGTDEATVETFEAREHLNKNIDEANES